MNNIAADVRIASIMMAYKAKSGHIGSCLSCADILVALYENVMTFDPKNPKSPLRDRFIMSKGHAAAAYYATLAKAGFFPESDLMKFGKDYSPYLTHVSEGVPGVEADSGSLGHGLSIGLGMALALRYQGPHVYVLCGDGELNEGSMWEAIMLAGQLRPQNLTLIVDRNQIQACGHTIGICDLHPLTEKFKAFGWHVEVCNGHEVGWLSSAMTVVSAKPKVVIAETHKGYGVSFMQDTVEWHYKVPTDEEMYAATKELEDAKGTDEPSHLSRGDG